MSNRPISSLDKPNNNNSKNHLSKSILYNNISPGLKYQLDPFLPSGTFYEDKYLGYPPAREEGFQNYFAKMRLVEKRQEAKENVISKHKQWLQDFENRLQSQKLAEIERQIERNKKVQSFSDTQTKLRQVLMNELEVSKEKVEELLDSKTKTFKEMVSSTNETVKKKESKKAKERKKAEKGEKPEWAMTREEIEKKQDKEEDEILDFVNDLDFDEYINDFEIKEALGVIQDRVKEIEKEKTNNEGSLKEQTEGTKIVSYGDGYEEKQPSISTQEQLSMPKIKKVKEKNTDHDKEWNSSTKLDEEKATKTVTFSIADDESETKENLLKIHSKASLGQVIQSARVSCFNYLFILTLR
ncbi:hypothetical protein ABK040_010583 [Willaertia magna]